MEIAGLPLHPLVVHAAVVFAPLAALTALVYAVVPKWRWLLRWPLVALTVVALGSALLAATSGESLLESRGLEELPGVEEHVEAGELLRNAMLGFSVLALLAAWRLGVASPLRPRTEAAADGAVGTIVRALLALAALVVLYAAVRAGHTGAVAVWG